MRATLRTWIGSWQVWTIVACLAYIGSVRGRGPSIAAVWLRGLWVAQGLLAAALLVLSWFFLKYIGVPFLMFLQGEKRGGRTAKAKEKLADSLMSFSTAVFSAVMISVLVFPLTAFIQTMGRGIDPVEALVLWWQSIGGSWMRPAWWSGWHTVVFLVFFWVPFSLGLLFRRRALDLYDAIASPTPVGAPTTQGTHEQPSFMDPGPPVYVKTNAGSQRRRRHRAK